MCFLLFSFGLWGDETGLCLPVGMVILGGRDLALRLLRLLRLFGVHKVGSETGVVDPFALLSGNELCLLLLGSELRLHSALLPLRAGPARNAGNGGGAGNGNAGRAKGRGSGLLRGRRRRQRRILRCCGDSCLLLLFLAFGLKLVLQVLHVVVGVVLQRRLWRLPFRSGLLRGRLLARRTEERRHDYEQCRSQIDERLEVLLQDALRLIQKAAQCWLDLRVGLWPGLRVCVRSTVVLSHR